MIIDSEPTRLAAEHLAVVLADGTRLLDDVSIAVRPREVVAIIGESGTGKSTLLDTLAGLRAPTSGAVRFGDAAGEPVVGYVPQDDIVHRELTVDATVRYSARLRLPPGASPAVIDAAVEQTLAMLGLTARRHQSVHSLSGGQRKRASIATELVTQPHVCFLDEPTAGLDPIAAAALMDVLRGLADEGTAIIMTTHNLEDLRVADRLVVLTHGGRVAFDGPPADAPRHFAVGDMADVCRVLATTSVETSNAPVGRTRSRTRSRVRATPRRRPNSPFAQWRILARRNIELITRNRMSLAIMAGSPVLVVVMFAVLFAPGAFDQQTSNPTASVAITYWISFAGFFFGLTFGLLQICTELAVLRRERLVAIDVGPYVLAKAAVLVPALGAVNVVMVATLVALDRLPAQDLTQVGQLLGILVLDSLAGLALGLLASASVLNPAQAALALPMLCFPAVLFSGAVLPLRSMTAVGRAIGALMSDRWAFEAVARTLHLEGTLVGSVGGRHIVAEHGGAFSGALLTHSLVIVSLTMILLVGAHMVVLHRTRQA